jgi:hypothetical protein
MLVGRFLKVIGQCPEFWLGHYISNHEDTRRSMLPLNPRHSTSSGLAAIAQFSSGSSSNAMQVRL